MPEGRKLVEKLLRHIDEDMSEPERTEHAEAVADEVTRAKENHERFRALHELLHIGDLLRDIDPRRK